MFSSLLIANRGEIACRIIATARRMGIRTIAIASEADRTWPHWRLADEAVFIGAGPAGESYLNIDKIIDAARRTGAEAVHPGYGFLAENADFAQRCVAAGQDAQMQICLTGQRGSEAARAHRHGTGRPGALQWAAGGDRPWSCC